MSLSEEQIVRYSRHILLTPVGGRGQEHLLSCGAQLIGGGGALATAAAYLAAGGSPVWGDQGSVGEDEVGFLYDAQDVGLPRNLRLDAALADLNPDAMAHRSGGALARSPARLSGPGPWVLIGATEGGAGIVFRSATGCEKCFQLNAARLAGDDGSDGEVLLGTVAALIFQRLALEMPPSLGGFWIGESGEITPIEMRACEQCR
jgi:hypothetical protein